MSKTEVSSFLLIVIIAIAISIPAAIGIYIALSSIDKQPQPIPEPEPLVCGNGTALVNGTCVPIVVPPPINDTIPPPTCEPDEIYNATLDECVEIPPEECTDDEVYNPDTNKCDPIPEPPPIICGNGTQLVNNTCVPIPPPTPEPEPIIKDIKVTVTGDVEDSSAGNAVFAQIKKQNADYDFVLGDLGYESNLAWFKSTYGTLGDKMYCVVGNHEADNEDGSSSIEKETLEFCGNSYWIKYYHTLFLMFNTNDNENTLITAVGKVFDNSTIMKDVKNVHVNGHKGCKTPPNSHHPAGEIADLCDYIESRIPTNVKAWYNSAHNHVYSESVDKTYKQSGAGGRSHYSCGTNAEFPYCNDSSYGFMLYTIKVDGTTTSQFIDYNGVVKR